MIDKKKSSSLTSLDNLAYTLDDEPLNFDPPAWVSIVAVLAMAGTLLIAAFIYFRAIPAVLLSVNVTIALGTWYATTYKRPAKRRVIPIYILVVIATLLHSGELHLGGYADRLTALFPEAFGEPVLFTEYWFIITFVLIPTAFYLLGAVGLFYHNPLGNFMAWWLFLWCIFFPASHYILPLFAQDDYRYLPGMFSAPIIIVSGMIGVRALVTHQLEEEVVS